MRSSHWYLRAVRALLPSPFSIAVLLTALVFVLALWFTLPAGRSVATYAGDLLGFWQGGFWNLLGFTMQMALMLILGHTLALTPFLNRVLDRLAAWPRNSGQAVAMVGLMATAVGLLNWGLSLIFGSILARRVGEQASRRSMPLPYPLVAAAGYTGLMVWHGGLSGSAPLTVASQDHFLAASIGQIPISQTLFSPMNLTATLLVLVGVPLLGWLLARRQRHVLVPELHPTPFVRAFAEKPSGAERLDHSPWLARALGLLMIGLSVYQGILGSRSGSLGFINLNFINFLLFGLCVAGHGSIQGMTRAVEQAITGAAGILIQFPLYAGIMGLMRDSGMAAQLSDWFVALSTPGTFPLYSMFSAAAVNTLVPSGGGQWAVQGPILTDAAMQLGVGLPKTVMALSYGDQLTNMIQPFWALPLLGITRLKARDILPYSTLFMLLGVVVYGFVLLVF